MARRLIRALERGGAGFLKTDGSFDVRRSTDARSAVIGVLASSEVSELKRQGHIKRLGDIEPPRFVWVGSALVDQMLSKASLDGFLSDDPPKPSSFVEQVLVSLPDPDEQKRLKQSVQWFRDDYDWAHQSAQIAGMNWNALSLGGRIDGASVHEGKADPLYKVGAERRLKHIERQLLERGYRQIIALVVDRISRKRFAANYRLGSHEAEVRAADLLRRLNWAYEKELKPPACVDVL